MNDRAALFAAILAHPNEDTPRLALADWLDEHEEPKYAAFIRKQVELADVPFWEAPRLAAWYDNRDALTGRGKELFQPALPDGLKFPPLTSYRRGFPWHVETTGVAPFLDHADWLVTQIPLQALTVRPEQGRWRIPMDFSALLASPRLAGLKQFNVTLARLTAETVRAIRECPYLANVTELAFDFAGLEAPALAEVFRPPLIERLESLRFDSCSLRWSDLAAGIAKAGGPHRLKRFVASEGSSAYFGNTRAFAAPLLRGLTEFEMTGFEMGEVPIRVLCESPVVRGLESLTLHRTNPGVHGLKALAGCEALSGVKRLRLGLNRLGVVAAKNLARSPHLGGLQVLDLGSNPLGDKGAAALAEAPWLPNLVELDLMHCEIGDAGATALMNALSPDKLVHLTLSSSSYKVKISDRVKKKLRDTFGDRAFV